ncbi:MAG: hypothetical protein U1E66_14325 [Rhodospirillales bacterium]
MAESKTFTGVDTATWERLQTLGREKHGTQFRPIDATSGEATTNTPFGRLVLNYEHDPASATITYTIVSKPLFVVSPLVWTGVESALAGCRRPDEC